MLFNRDNMAIFWYTFSQFQSKLLTLISALNPFLQSKYLLGIAIKFMAVEWGGGGGGGGRWVQPDSSS